MALTPSRPGFEEKPKKAAGKKKPAPDKEKPVRAKRPRQETPKPEATRRRTGTVETPKVIPAPKELEMPFKGRKVTAGPYTDDRAKYGQNWTVITRQGDLVEYHRFRSEEEARTFAEAVGR